MSGVVILLATAAALVIAMIVAMIAWEAAHPRRRTAGYAIARGLAVDPQEAGLEYESWMLDRPDGAALPVWDVRLGSDGGGAREARERPAHAERGDTRPTPSVGVPAGLTIVFIHGWGQSRIDMLAASSAYRSQAARMIFYDLRGHGEAEGGASHLGWNEERDLIELLRRIGPADVVLVGHSMGGVIALRAAAALRDDAPIEGVAIRGIVAYGPYASTIVPLGNRLRIMNLPAAGVARLALLSLRICCGVRDVAAEAAAGRVEAPVLIFLGERDEVTPRGEIDRLRRAMPQSELVMIAGAAHSDMHSHDAQHHDEAVRAFIEEIDAPRRADDGRINPSPASASEDEASATR